MYLPSTFRARKPELSRKERDRIDSTIWDAGLWSEDSMRNALTQGFSSTLLKFPDKIDHILSWLGMRRIRIE